MRALIQAIGSNVIPRFLERAAPVNVLASAPPSPLHSATTAIATVLRETSHRPRQLFGDEVYKNVAENFFRDSRPNPINLKRNWSNAFTTERKVTISHQQSQRGI